MLFKAVSRRFFVWVVGCVGCLVGFAALGASPVHRTPRVLVMMKDSYSSSQAANQLMSQSLFRMQRFFSLSSAPSLKVTRHLSQLNGLVLSGANTDEYYDLQNLAGVELVEQEVFRPLPRPVVRQYLRRHYLAAGLAEGQAQAEAPTSPAPLQKLTTPIRQPWGIAKVKAPQVWSQGYYGQGAKVLVLDTGVDRDHPVLQQAFKAGKNFLTQAEGDFMDAPEVPAPNVSTEEKAPLPYEYFDDVGHGTHVAGTILAAQQADGFSGVAPQAELYVGKVCDLEGCSNIAVALGIDWGATQQTRVLNLSLGGDDTSKAEKMAIQKAERLGIIVVAASGNDGKPKVGFPAAYPTSIAVGAIDADGKKADFSQWGNELDVMAPGVEILSSVPMGTAKVSKVFAVNMGDKAGDKASADLEIPSRAFFDSAAVDKEIQLPIADFGLGVISGQNLQGQIALIDRGQNSFEDKVKNAVRLGAKAVLIVNDEPGLFEGSVSSDENSTKLSPVPVFMIEKTSGQMLRQSLQKGQSVQVRLQSFVSDYDLYSGTSMATPHVAGLVALLLSAKPDLSPGQARDILSKSCEPIPGENTHRVGNGLLQADKALGKVLEIR